MIYYKYITIIIYYKYIAIMIYYKYNHYNDILVPQQ